LKVTRVTATPLAVPFRETHVTWTGRYAAKSTVLIEVHTDAGLVGLGEAPPVPTAGIVQALIEEMAPALVGHDPGLIHAFHDRALALQPATGLPAMTLARFRDLVNNALGGIDLALWDLLGQSTGEPLHRLLGGKRVDAIDMFAWLHRKPPEAMVADALAFKQRGFRVFYLKIGLGPVEDMTVLAALREALGPDAVIRGDANGAWTATEAIANLRALEPFRLDWVEQPVREDDLDGFERVARTVATPLCIDQAVNTARLAGEAIRRRLADVICSDLHRMGGVAAFREMAAAAALAGIGVCRHAGPELGISAAAHLHLMATIPNATLGNQTYATTVASDIVNEPINTFVDGCLRVPDAPGLGVTLDRDAVERHVRLYRELTGGASS